MNLSIGTGDIYTGGTGGIQNGFPAAPEKAREEEQEQKRRELMGIEDPVEKYDPTKENDPSGVKAPREKNSPSGKKTPAEECQTCKNRKYQDGSDEMVSFKSAAHISPESAGARVRAHEQEHVSNAYKKAAQGNGKVISASVSIHTAVCPECGRTYVSGGTTNTQIKYYNEDNPYQKGLKTADQAKYSGMNADYAV